MDHASAPDPGTRTQTSGTTLSVFLRYLKAEGVRVVFGIPGGLLYPFFEAVEVDRDLQLVITKHEEGAAFMADGFARSGGSLAVCAGTSGPGSTNMLTGVACAFADSVPMLVLTGQAASHALGRGAAQETTREDIDIVAMFSPVTKYSAMVTTAESLGRHLRRALRLALSGRPGPVHLNVPVDLWEQPAHEDWFNPATYRPRTHTFDRRSVQAASEALAAARRPMILAGSGVGTAGAEEHLRALAELLPAPVATTPRGKGLFPEDHRLSLGVLGLAGHRAARHTVLGSDVDVLLTVGASLSETATFNWAPELRPNKTLIQIDIEPDKLGRNYPVDIPLVGDAQTILVELVYHLHRRSRDGHDPASSWRREGPVQGVLGRYDELDLRRSRKVPIAPQRWRAELAEALPDDAIIFSDIGGHMLFNIHDLCVRGQQKFLLNLGFGSMGHGTVAPIGAALANRGRTVVAVVGDACFTMNGMDLLTAYEYEIPVIWIVENNGGHGITWHASDKVTKLKRKFDAVLYRQPVEVASIARAMGLSAWVVQGPGELPDVFEAARSSRCPAVIEIRVDPTIPPPLGARAESLAGFIKE